jgi:hypothetical protein
MNTVTPHTEHGYLVLADISGYNAFMAGTEQDHAQEIIRELLEFLIGKFQPLLTLVEIRGDAVFAYAAESKIVRGETLFELIENTYTAFKDRLASLRRHPGCTCAACRNAHTLDLKFLVHHGEYISHRIQDHQDLMGFAPMFVREREWKEPVAESAGWRGYALFTTEGLAHLNLHPDELQAIQFSGSPLKTFGLNLQARYQRLIESRRVIVSAQDADAASIRTIHGSPSSVWAWLNEPDKRNQWWPSFVKWTISFRPGGRTGPGAVNHCDHGVGNVRETVLDWRPFDYFTVELRLMPGSFKFLQTMQLEALPGNQTRLHLYLRLQDHRWLARPFCGLLAWFYNLELNQLNRLLSIEINNPQK